MAASGEPSVDEAPVEDAAVEVVKKKKLGFTFDEIQLAEECPTEVVAGSRK